MNAKAITAETNRGMQLDVIVFIINLALINLLMRYSLDIFRLAAEGDAFGGLTLALCAGAMLVLPAIAAVLKRWHFHRRLSARPKPEGEATKLPFDPLNSNVTAFLFHPVFYFVLSIFLSGVLISLLMHLFFRQYADIEAVFTTLVFGSFVACVVQTVLVYRYLLPPKKEPSALFLRNPASERVGDLCIFINVILFQVFWNLAISQFPFVRAVSAGEFSFNLFILVFFALLIYFPPRIFYLAEDIHRPATWLTILLANSPTILRALFGDNAGADW